MDHKILRFRGLSKYLTIKCLSFVLLTSGFSAQIAMGAPSPDDPPLPPPDVGAPTLPSTPILPRGHKHQRLSTGPVAPEIPLSRPQQAISEVKSLAQKQVAIDKRRVK
jgi:hypothetical protein